MKGELRNWATIGYNIRNRDTFFRMGGKYNI